MHPDIHLLKTWPIYFAAVADATMTFQLRRRDRDFKINDHLVLKEYDPVTEEFTGRMVERRVTSIFEGEQLLADETRHVLAPGYVILGMAPVPYGQSLIEDQRPAHIAA